MKDRAKRAAAAGLALALAAAGWRTARAADVGQLNSLLNRAASYPADAGVMNQIEDICLRAGRPGAEAERAAVSVAILSKLGPETPADARAMFLKQLERIGGAEVVTGLGQLVMLEQDDRVRECARRALQNNPAPQAGKALLKALERMKDTKSRAALVDSIGYRGDPEAVDDLVKLLDERDKDEEEVAVSAAAALGRIGGQDAAKALSSAMSKGSPEFRAAATDAYISCADIFLAEGDFTEATAIYKKLYSAQGSNLLKIAGMQGLAAVQAAKEAGRKEVRSKPSGKEKPASAAARKPAVPPEVAAEWDAKLQARLEESVKAGKKPSFQLASMRTRVQVVSVADGGEIKVSAKGMQLGVPMSRLTPVDKKNLAAAVAGEDPAANAVAAFYCLLTGDKAAAGAHLRKAGDQAGEVGKLFE